MGWWKVPDTEIVLGDLPLDELGDAARRVCAHYRAAWGRAPTLAEWETLMFEMVKSMEDVDDLPVIVEGRLKSVTLALEGPDADPSPRDASLAAAVRRLRDHPEQYLADRSLAALADFLTKYAAGLDATQPPDRFPHADTLRAFAAAIRARFGATHGEWWTLVLQHCGGDEAAAFARFFDLWDELVKDA